MKTGAQINAFAEDLDRLVDRYAMEFDLPLAAIVGTLTMKATLLTLGPGCDDEDDGPEEGPASAP